MNTANLQLAGLYAAVAAITNALRDKGLLTEAEIEAALRGAETMTERDPLRAEAVSISNVEAICFPIRYLRQANRSGAAGERLTFTEITQRVAEHKPER